MPYSTRNTVLVRWALKQWKIPLNWHLLLIINCIYVELGDGSIINYWSFCSLTCDVLSNSDLVLSNKLVVYDVQNQTIGWTDFNCEYFMLFEVFSLSFHFFFQFIAIMLLSCIPKLTRTACSCDFIQQMICAKNLQFLYYFFYCIFLKLNYLVSFSACLVTSGRTTESTL